MRMLQWPPEAIRYMRNAAEYGDYYQKLAACILPHLRSSDIVCDMGCGMGQLSVELSKSVQRIAAVDRNADAIAELTSEIDRRGVTNIEPICSDAHTFAPGDMFDAMIFCLYGGIEDILELSRRMCRGRVFMIQRYKGDELRDVKKGCGTAKKTVVDALTENRIRFVYKRMSLELDQPLRDMEDARFFFRIYPPNVGCNCENDDALRSLLRPIDLPNYKYVFPTIRHLEMYVWDMQGKTEKNSSDT